MKNLKKWHRQPNIKSKREKTANKSKGRQKKQKESGQLNIVSQAEKRSKPSWLTDVAYAMGRAVENILGVKRKLKKENREIKKIEG